MRIRTVVALTLVAALGVSAAVAIAAPPPDRPGAAAKAQAQAKAQAAKAKAAQAKMRQARLQLKEENEVLDECRPRVSYILKGTFVSHSIGDDGMGSLVMDVKRANMHAKLFVGKQVTITLGDRSRIVGAGLRRASEGTFVLAHVRGCKDKGESVELYAKHLVLTPAKPADDEDEEEEEETETTETETTTTTTP